MCILLLLSFTSRNTFLNTVKNDSWFLIDTLITVIKFSFWGLFYLMCILHLYNIQSIYSVFADYLPFSTIVFIQYKILSHRKRLYFWNIQNILKISEIFAKYYWQMRFYVINWNKHTGGVELWKKKQSVKNSLG